VVSQAADPPDSEERVDRRHLTESRPVRWDVEAATPKAMAALDVLLADLEALEPPRPRRRRTADRERLRAILEAITLELWLYRCEAPAHWLAYARGGPGYEGPGRYRHPLATQTTVVTTADFLISSGLAEDRVGSQRRVNEGFGTSAKGYLSRLRGTEGLLAWAARFELTTDDVSTSSRIELIRLKGVPATPDGRKLLIDYSDTPATALMRDRLIAWMGAMEAHKVSLPGAAPSVPRPADVGVVVPELENADERPRAASGGPCKLYRVFNNGRWDQGGRFYGGWWMALPKRDRERLLIDGQETVELDFASLHPRLCYQLNGRPMDPAEDAYDLPGVPIEHRDIVKVAFMQLLNAKPGQGRIRPPAGVVQKLGRRLSYQRLIRALQAKHVGISNWFFQGPKSLELQAVDAAIAEVVMGYFTAVQRPVLPVHDSFIVKRADQYKLAETMALAYRAQLTLKGIEKPVMPPIRGWVDDDAEARFNAFAARWGDED
jgi:hypothetical protein